MNIFVLDKNPKEAVKLLCDCHIVKMTLETAQLLCTATHIKTGKEMPYKPTHRNHPCIKWLLENESHMNWLFRYGLNIADEFRYRFGKSHKSENVIKICLLEFEGRNTRHLEEIRFVQCMPDEYKSSKQPIHDEIHPDIAAYREYYMKNKKPLLEAKNMWKFTKRNETVF